MRATFLSEFRESRVFVNRRTDNRSEELTRADSAIWESKFYRAALFYASSRDKKSKNPLRPTLRVAGDAIRQRESRTRRVNYVFVLNRFIFRLLDDLRPAERVDGSSLMKDLVNEREREIGRSDETSNQDAKVSRISWVFLAKLFDCVDT